MLRMTLETPAPKNSGRFTAGNPGKPKGAVSKLPKAAKETIAEVAERLGGADGMHKWCLADDLNLRAFWSSIYPKLLPLQVTGEGGGPIRIAASALSDDDLASIAAGGMNG